jgi:hypothetical protein
LLLAPEAMAGNGVLGSHPGMSGPASTGFITGLGGGCVDVVGAVATNQAAVQLWTCNAGDNQSWVLNPNGTITGIDGKCLDVPGSNTAPGTPVQIYDCNGGANQQWNWNPNGTITGIGGMCLDLPGANTAPGTHLQIYTCNGGTNQKWLIHGTSEVRGFGGKCFDVPGGSTTLGTAVQYYDCNGGANQKWTLTPSGNLVTSTGLCLDLPGANTANGTGVQIYTCNGGANQVWRLQSNGTLVGYGGKCLDLPGWNTANQTPIQIFDCNGGSNKVWAYETPLTVSLFPQEQSNWCWAATGKMIMSYLGKPVAQCDEANYRFGRNDCCTYPSSSACNLGGWPDFSHFGFSSSTTSSAALSFATIQSQIDAHKPIAYSWHWNSGGGHMMALIGYKTVAGSQYVTIDDPWAPNEGDQTDILYSVYVSGDTYTHWNDYYNITAQ